MTHRNLDDYEATCISTCVQKHVNVNHKTMECFAEINPIFQQRKLEEHQKELQQLQQQQQEAAQKAAGAGGETTTTSTAVASS